MVSIRKRRNGHGAAANPQRRPAPGGDGHRGLYPGGGRRGHRQDPGALPALCLPGGGGGHSPGEYSLRHLHQQVCLGDAPADPRPHRRQRHRLHQHLPRLLRVHPPGGQPRRAVPQALSGAGQQRHRRHAPAHLRRARPLPAGHDLRGGAGHDRDGKAGAPPRLLPGSHHPLPGHPAGKVRKGRAPQGHHLLRRSLPGEEVLRIGLQRPSHLLPLHL